MKELIVGDPNTLRDDQRKDLALILCDESSINCRSLRDLQDIIQNLGSDVVLAMPDNEYKKGLRGWAKAQILASVADNLKIVMPVSFGKAVEEAEKDWLKVIINGTSTWHREQTIPWVMAKNDRLEFTDTDDEFDRQMMKRAIKVVEKSNCWLDPAGCVIVRDKKVLVEDTSTSFNDSRCTEIPVKANELSLDMGERMIFCDSLHAERVTISRAAKEGVSLQGSTMYVTKFPCRPCATSAIAAGITTIVFDKPSYGLLETADLFKSKEIALKYCTK